MVRYLEHIHRHIDTNLHITCMISLIQQKLKMYNEIVLNFKLH